MAGQPILAAILGSRVPATIGGGRSRVLAVCCLATTPVVVVACNRHTEGTRAAFAESYISVPGAVAFDIEPLHGKDSREWLAVYTSQGKTARFRIELDAPKSIDDSESRAFGVKSGRGRFISEPGSDAGVLLSELKAALEAKSLPVKSSRVNSLSFTFVSLGENKSQAANGGFADNPPGNWRPMKIFIGQGEKEGEVFLNLNPVLRKGQFSIKDPEYGDVVLEQLSTVL